VGIFHKKQITFPDTYFAFVHTHLFDGIELYANTSSTHLSKLETVSNKLLRILQIKPHNFPSKERYAEYNTLSIPDMHVLQILLLVHKFMHHKHRLP